MRDSEQVDYPGLLVRSAQVARDNVAERPRAVITHVSKMRTGTKSNTTARSRMKGEGRVDNDIIAYRVDAPRGFWEGSSRETGFPRCGTERACTDLRWLGR